MPIKYFVNNPQIPGEAPTSKARLGSLDADDPARMLVEYLSGDGLRNVEQSLADALYRIRQLAFGSYPTTDIDNQIRDAAGTIYDHAAKKFLPMIDKLETLAKQRIESYLEQPE